MSRRRRSTRDLLVGLIAPVLALMLLLGVVAVVSFYRISSTVTAIDREVLPAISANRTYLDLVGDAESAVRGWAISGGPETIQRYEATIAELPSAASKLRELADDDDELQSLIAEQEALTAEWIAVYAEPRLAAEAGQAGYDLQRSTDGQAVYVELRSVNDQILTQLELQRDSVAQSANTAFRILLTVMIVLTLAAGGLALYLGRRVRDRLERPLAELERTVEALSAGQSSARARIGGPREIVAVAHALNQLADESERAQALEAETREQLLELDQAKSDFVSNVSHELRTPLTSIKGYLELLRDDIDPQGAAARPWDVIDRNVHRLGLLVEDLLTLANVESRNTTLTEIDLRGIVEDVGADLRIAANNRKIAMTIDVPPAPIRVLADKVQLLRAVLNVVSNAVKFCRDGGQIDVRLVSDGSNATLTVRDTGIGIPADQLASLGGRFFRASNAVKEQIGGTGLGVRMVQSIVTKHGGTVAFESAENEYTLVTITLPIRGDLDT